MEQRMEQMEKTMESVAGQGELILNLTEMINKLGIQVDEIATRTNGNKVGENSRGSRGTPHARRNVNQTQISGSYVPKTVKIDFPSYEGKGDPSIWLSKVEQFFRLHDIPENDQQTGTVQDYQDKFEKLLAKVGPLEQPRQVSSFVDGLRDSIHTDVRANKPQTLATTIGLARLYEACDLGHRKAIISDSDVDVEMEEDGILAEE
ncbi:hypothetical protein LWI28_000257 [Acer negundo]|uniref:Retrotransposon gag domain-containing protein n=1 Tax=Acer negundo TaxID=4023 RepID=A0AAD5J8U0_ACENE|nr:hypothetical protein LWI28_000257 [Acer negundo]